MAKEAHEDCYEDHEFVDPATGRRIRTRLRWPEQRTARPLIVWSPGLGGGLGNGRAFCEAWRRAGFAVATIAHPASDDGIWIGDGRSGLRQRLVAALAAGQYGLRVQDCRWVIAKLVAEHGAGAGARIDATRIGLAGHSYGAHTVQVLAIEDAGRGRRSSPAFAAAIALSPGARTVAAARAFAGVRMAFFCVTGERDEHVTLGQGVDALRAGMVLRSRLAVYQHLPRGARQLLVLAGADHMALAGEPVDARRFSRDVPAAGDAAVRARVALATTAFWQRHLGDAGGAAMEERAAYGARIRAALDPRDRLELG